jgi:hypothetical protein
MEQLTRRVSPSFIQVHLHTHTIQQILQLRQQQQLPQRRRQQRHKTMVHQIPLFYHLSPRKTSSRFRLDSRRLLQRPIPLRLRNRRFRLFSFLLSLYLRRMAQLRIQHRHPIRRRQRVCLTNRPRNRNRLRARDPGPTFPPYH